ncbi:hypothetical protein EV363DRAFT_1344097 [Boletus edulis]|nr:hypothetical protein EV363DRAFT_1344097 [Boletus edulis]
MPRRWPSGLLLLVGSWVRRRDESEVCVTGESRDAAIWNEYNDGSKLGFRVGRDPLVATASPEPEFGQVEHQICPHALCHTTGGGAQAEKKTRVINRKMD